MASSVASGYDLDWVEDPPDDLKCLICLCVARDPRQHPGDDNNDCGKIFCLECITKYQKRNTKCPNCRQNLTIFKDARSTRAIKALKVKCDNESNGCEWTGELGYLETHLVSCDYALVPCTNQCKTDNEISKFLRTYLNNHLNNECPRRQYECPHCQETGEHQERTTTHLDTCPRVEVHCPNVDCQDTIPRCDIETHLSTCAYEPVSCKYAAVGCEEKPLRKDLKKHEEDDQLHLRITTKKILELTEKFAVFERSVQNIQVVHEEELRQIKYKLLKSASLTPCTFKLTNYLQLKNENAEFHSFPFYTSCSGYKMFIIVYANSDDGAGTHVSVYACLIKGDHDNTLIWPFTGSVTVKLLNQLEDRNHHKLILTFPADNEASERVVDNEEKRVGYGRPQFISYAALDYNARTNTQYLKDDTLVFRVSVEAPNHKPWLECTI